MKDEEDEREEMLADCVLLEGKRREGRKKGYRQTT